MAKPLPRVGLSIGEFIGWRIWEVHKLNDAPTLRSWVYACFWLPGSYISDISADAMGFEGVGIDDHNERGVWGFKTKELREAEFTPGMMSLQLNIVWGTCWMWGTIIECEKGWRSQYASVRSIDMSDCSFADTSMLREKYNVGASE